MQQYQIKWKNHQKNFQTEIPKYFQNKQYLDCNLLVEGSHLVPCHKFVLDACSDYFASFLNNKSLEDKNLVICLPTEIKLWEVEAILAFMYNGSVAISQEGLSSLVKVAEMLQVKGLCGESTSITANEQNSQSKVTNNEEVAPESTFNESTEMLEVEESNESTEQCGYNGQMIIKREIDISDVDDQESAQGTSRQTSPKASGLIRVKQNLFKAEATKKISSSETGLVYNKKSMDIYVKDKKQGEASRCSTPVMPENSQQFEDIVCSPTLIMQYDEEQHMDNFDDDDDFIIEESGCNDELFNIITQKFEKCEQFSICDSNDQNSKLLISSVSSQFNQNFRGQQGEDASNVEMKSAIGGLYLRNPRGNQERKYDVNALYSALQDVKNGHSIYRAAQTYSIPRKTLRNWMKRLHIKSAFPMPKQLKQAAERKKHCDSIMRKDERGSSFPNAIELS